MGIGSVAIIIYLFVVLTVILLTELNEARNDENNKLKIECAELKTENRMLKERYEPSKI